MSRGASGISSEGHFQGVQPQDREERKGGKGSPAWPSQHTPQNWCGLQVREGFAMCGLPPASHQRPAFSLMEERLAFATGVKLSCTAALCIGKMRGRGWAHNRKSWWGQIIMCWTARASHETVGSSVAESPEFCKKS